MEGYCLKCKKKRKMKQLHKIKQKGRNYVKGVCEVCSTKMSKITK